MKTEVKRLPAEMDEATRKVLNHCAREQMKLKLLADIMVDLTICDIEGWDKKDYLRELKELIDSFKL